MQYRNIDKQALKDNGYTVLSKITIVGTNTIFTEDDYIVDWDYEDYRFVPNTGFIGQFVERILDGNLQNISEGVILEDTEINLQLGIKNALDNNTVTWYDYGNFLVTKVEKTDTTGNYRFESADYTKKFNKVFDGDYKDTTYTKSFNEKIEDEETVTALWLAQYVCKQAGVVLYTTNFTNYNFVISSNQYDSEDTLRKVMQDIGKLAYSWVRVGEDNKVHIDFTPKATSSVDQYDQLTTDEYYVSKKSDLAFGPVNKVLIGMSDVEGENLYVTSQDYTPETECAIKIYDNNLTNTEELRQTALNGASRLFGLTYTPIEINSVGHPWLDGDELIKLTNVDEEIIYTYPFNRKIHYAGYIEGVIGAEASSTQNSKYEYKSDIISNVKRTTIIVDKQEQTITALAEDVSENTSDISQMQIDLNGIDLRVQSVESTEVTAVTNEYAVNSDASTAPTTGWSTTKPTRGEGQYIWARIKTTYKSGDIVYSDPVNTTGDKGDTGGAGPQGPQGPSGDDGASIDTIINYYAVSTSNEEAPSSWTTDLSSIELTETNKYLWSYDEITYTEGKQSTETGARVIGVYGNKGNPGTDGQPGAEGRGISSLVNYYLATDQSSNVTRSTSGWTTSIQTMTTQKPYLWNYQKITYTKGTTTEYTNPVIIGVYGLPGDPGKGIVSVTDLYYVGSSGTAPSKPSAHVTTNVATYNTWSTQCAQYTTTYQYFYTCSEILYSDNTYGWTNVVNNQGLAFANSTAYNANQTANTANSTANTASQNASTALSTANTANSTATSASTTANTALNNINNLQIGGTNLLMYTAYTTLDGVNNRGNYHTVSIDTTEKFNNNSSLKIVCSTPSVSGSQDVWQKCWTYQIVGKPLRLSLYIKGSTTGKMFFRLAGAGSNKSSATYQYNVSTSWTKLDIDLGTVTSGGTAGQTEIIYGFDTAGTYYINSMMLEYGTKSSNWSPAPEDTTTTISNLNTYVNTNIQNLQNQIDGAIQFWNGEDIPTLNNYPASSWTTEAERTNHQADIYTVIQDVSGELKQGKGYRFDKVNGTWVWVEITDQEMSAVQALASSKATVYVTTPTPPYNVGDLWLKDNKLYRCSTAKDSSGSYSASDWVVATDYTNDTVANQALSVANAAEKKVYHTCSSSGGTNGYFYFATCVVTQTYANKPITFSIYNRSGYKSTVDFQFKNANNTDPGLARVNKTGTAQVYIVKADTSTWDLYVKKTESYDNATFTEFSMGGYDSKFTWTWKDQTVTELPTGYVTATNDDDVIIGTQSSATNAFTGVASFPTLLDGQQIMYWLPYNNPSGNATLNLTLSTGSTTGAVNIYYSGTNRLTTHYGAGNIIRMVYRVNTPIGGSGSYTGWWCDANYNSDTYDRIRFNQNVTAGSAITAGKLLAKVNTSFVPLTTSLAFDVTQPIIYAGSNINSGASGNNNYLSFPSVNLTNTVSGITLTNQQTCYLVGTLNGKTFTTISSEMLTTTVPTTEDGYYYMSLGYMYSTTNMILFPEHPLFKYVDGEFKSLNQVGYDAQVNLDNLEIGGRNLLRNSSNLNFDANINWVWYALNNVTTGDYATDGYHIVTPTTGQAGNNGKGLKLDITQLGLDYGDTCTFSFDIKGTIGSTSTSGTIAYMQSTTSNNAPYAYIQDLESYRDIIQSNKFTRISATFTIRPENTFNTASKNYIYLQFRLGYGSDVYIKNMQLERGDKATDWKLAPEDTETRQYGGRNLALQTKDFTVSSTTGSGNLPNENYWSINTGIITVQLSDDNESNEIYVSRSGATTTNWSRAICHKYFTQDEINTEYVNGLTVSFDLKVEDTSALDNGCLCAVQTWDNTNTRVGWYEYANIISGKRYEENISKWENNTWRRAIIHFTKTDLLPVSASGKTVDDISYSNISFQLVKNGAIHIRKIKIEAGDIATDWTEAPEDISDEINDVNSQFSNYVTQTSYDADWANRKDEIYSYVNVNYTTSSAFGTYQETMQTALSQKADATTISATATQVVNDAISGIQSTISDIEETFTFDTNGLTIARGGNTMYLQLQNDRLSFRTDNTTAGERAYMTSNAFVLKELTQFQIGNFKFEVRTNGSLDFKKV